MINITGKKYNRLTPVVYLGKSRWRCVCDCGKLVDAQSYGIIHGRAKSCGCLQKECARNINLKKWGESAFTNIYCGYRVGAKNRGLSFDLSRDELRNIISKPCHYCGTLPNNEKKSRFNNGSYYYNGIDRINSDIGYEANNIVPCCWQCNSSKGRMDYKEFIAWIRKAYRHAIDINLKESVIFARGD